LPIHRQRRTISLHLTILLIFVGLLLLTAAAMIGASTYRFSRATSYNASNLMKVTSADVLHHLHAGLYPTAIADQLSATLITRGTLSQDEQHLLPYITDLLKTTPLARGVYWYDQSGYFVDAQRESNGNITTSVFKPTLAANKGITVHYDSQGRIISTAYFNTPSYVSYMQAWYAKAAQTKRFFFSQVQQLYPTQLGLGMSAVAPSFNQSGQVRGIFVVIFNLNYVEQYLTAREVPTIFSFILTNNGNLIAYPKRWPFNAVTSHPHQLPNVLATPLPLITQALNTYQTTKQSALTIRDHDVPYFVTFEAIPDFAQYGWLVGVATPQSYFTDPLKRFNVMALVISGITLILGIVLFSVLASRVVKPIKHLVQETEKIKNFDLSDDVHSPSRINEVVLLQDAMNSMKKGLRDFQKYLPKTLVQQLLRAKKETQTGGVRKNVVVFFSDIHHFTTIAEKANPKQLTQQLCDYFSQLSDIITANGGTIDKYIGDAIMAFWGAPLADSHACEHAAKAALQCREKIEQLNKAWLARGMTPFLTRIGLHMGEAIVGNIGSAERLSYTAIGDTINIASRIEEMNKNYDTRILVSEIVAQTIANTFSLKFVDYLLLKGRTEKINVFDLESEDIPATRVARSF